MIGFDIILKVLKRVDPKWLPAIAVGVLTLGSVIYLVYTKKRAETLNDKLKKKLALAESAALDAQAERHDEVAEAHEARATKIAIEAEKIKEEIRDINVASTKRREKILAATSWEDLGL